MYAVMIHQILMVMVYLLLVMLLTYLYNGLTVSLLEMMFVERVTLIVMVYSEHLMRCMQLMYGVELGHLIFNVICTDEK